MKQFEASQKTYTDFLSGRTFKDSSEGAKSVQAAQMTLEGSPDEVKEVEKIYKQQEQLMSRRNAIAEQIKYETDSAKLSQLNQELTSINEEYNKLLDKLSEDKYEKIVIAKTLIEENYEVLAELIKYRECIRVESEIMRSQMDTGEQYEVVNGLRNAIRQIIGKGEVLSTVTNGEGSRLSIDKELALSKGLEQTMLNFLSFQSSEDSEDLEDYMTSIPEKYTAEDENGKRILKSFDDLLAENNTTIDDLLNLLVFYVGLQDKQKDKLEKVERKMRITGQGEMTIFESRVQQKIEGYRAQERAKLSALSQVESEKKVAQEMLP